MPENIRDYEDVTVYSLDDDKEAELIAEQNECTLVWVTRDGSPMAVIMSYLRRDGKFWMTATSQRKRISAMRRDPRVAVVITSPGTSLGPGKTVTYKGTAAIHEDPEIKAWFYPALAERIMGRWGPERVKEFAVMLDSPRRLVIEITPTKRVGYDGDKIREATKRSREAGVLEVD